MHDLRPRLLTRRFLLVALTQTTFSFSWSMFLLLPKYLAVELGADSTQIGSLAATSGIAAVVAIPATGALIDRVGRKPLMLAGCLMAATYAFAFTRVDTVDVYLYLLQPLNGLSFALTFNAGATLVADGAPPSRLSEAMSWFGAANVLMNAVAASVGELLAAASSWNDAFMLAGVVGLVAAGLSTAIHETGKRTKGAGSAGDDGAGALTTQLVRDAVVMLIGGAAFAGLFTYYQPFALQLGITELRPFFIGFSAAVLTARVLLGGLPDRLGRRRTATLSLLAYTAILGSLPLLQERTLPLYGAAFGLAHGFFYPAMNALAVEGRAPGGRGRAMVVINGGFQAGYTFGVLALGHVAAAWGFTSVFLLAAALAFGAMWLVRPAPTDRRTARTA